LYFFLYLLLNTLTGFEEEVDYERYGRYKEIKGDVACGGGYRYRSLGMFVLG